MSRFNSGERRDDLIRPSARQLEIIQQIAVQPWRWTRRELAEFHEVEERTVQRDLDVIRHKLRIVVSKKPRHGGYAIEHMPHLPTVAYSFSEALALLQAARLAQASPGANSAELAAAIARLESLFPVELVPFLRRAAEKLPGRALRAHRQEMLFLLHRALVERRQVRVHYATASRRGHANWRLVHPYHLLPYDRSWQLVAYCCLRRQVLLFKVDRVLEAEISDETFVETEDFDLETYLGDAWGVMRGSPNPAEDISLLFEQEWGRWVSENDWHPSQQVEELADGRWRVQFHVCANPEMLSWLMRFGDQVYVEQPQSLRDELREMHRRAAIC